MERNVSSATRTTDRKILYHFLQNVKSTTILLYFIKLAQSFCTFTKLEVLLLFPKRKLKQFENCSLGIEIQLCITICTEYIWIDWNTISRIWPYTYLSRYRVVVGSMINAIFCCLYMRSTTYVQIPIFWRLLDHKIKAHTQFLAFYHLRKYPYKSAYAICCIMSNGISLTSFARNFENSFIFHMNSICNATFGPKT